MKRLRDVVKRLSQQSPKLLFTVRIRASLPGTRLRLALQEAKAELWRSQIPREIPYGIPPDWYLSNMKFYYIYILHNHSKKFIYVGYSEDIKSRFESHNKGKVTSTKSYIPLNLIHYEAYRNMKDAKRREKYLKTNKGRTTLITMLSKYFEA